MRDPECRYVAESMELRYPPWENDELGPSWNIDANVTKACTVLMLYLEIFVSRSYLFLAVISDVIGENWFASKRHLVDFNWPSSSDGVENLEIQMIRKRIEISRDIKKIANIDHMTNAIDDCEMKKFNWRWSRHQKFYQCW